MEKRTRNPIFGSIQIYGVPSSYPSREARKFIKTFTNEIIAFKRRPFDVNSQIIHIEVSSIESLVTVLFIDFSAIGDRIVVDFQIKLTNLEDGPLIPLRDLDTTSFDHLQPLRFLRKRIKALMLLNGRLPREIQHSIQQSTRVLKVEGLGPDFAIIQLVNLIESMVAPILGVNTHLSSQDPEKIVIYLHMANAGDTQRVITMMERKKHYIFRDCRGEISFKNPEYIVPARELLIPACTLISLRYQKFKMESISKQEPKPIMNPNQKDEILHFKSQISPKQKKKPKIEAGFKCYLAQRVGEGLNGSRVADQGKEDISILDEIDSIKEISGQDLLEEDDKSRGFKSAMNKRKQIVQRYWQERENLDSSPKLLLISKHDSRTQESNNDEKRIGFRIINLD